MAAINNLAFHSANAPASIIIPRARTIMSQLASSVGQTYSEDSPAFKVSRGADFLDSTYNTAIVVGSTFIKLCSRWARQPITYIEPSEKRSIGVVLARAAEVGLIAPELWRPAVQLLWDPKDEAPVVVTDASRFAPNEEMANQNFPVDENGVSQWSSFTFEEKWSAAMRGVRRRQAEMEINVATLDEFRYGEGGLFLPTMLLER